jgi:lipoate-protein ligase B
MQLRCCDLGLVEYRRALALQEACVEQRRRGDGQDTLLLLEHPPVFTLGRGADERFVLNPGRVPVHRVSRGGQVTFHGPGQLIGYPILALPRQRRDVHAYIRRLENVLIQTLASYGLQTRQREGLTGVWCGEDKIASIGVGIRRWVTFHGFALNVDPDLSYFDSIVPCGLADVRMTSMARALGRSIALQAVKIRLAEIFADTFAYEETVWNTSGLTADSPNSLSL